MLHSINKSISRHSLRCIARRSLSGNGNELGPSPTTTVLLRNLAPNTTESSLKTAINGVSCRKVEIEPGCSIHTMNEAAASYIASVITSQESFMNKVEVAVSSATLPALYLQNLPSSIDMKTLETSFGKYKPALVRLMGTSTIQVHE